MLFNNNMLLLNCKQASGRWVLLQCGGGCEVLGVKRRTVHCVWSGNRQPADTACDSLPRPASYKPCRSSAQHCPSRPGHLDPSESLWIRRNSWSDKVSHERPIWPTRSVTHDSLYIWYKCTVKKQIPTARLGLYVRKLKISLFLLEVKNKHVDTLRTKTNFSSEAISHVKFYDWHALSSWLFDTVSTPLCPVVRTHPHQWLEVLKQWQQAGIDDQTTIPRSTVVRWKVKWAVA